MEYNKSVLAHTIQRLNGTKYIHKGMIESLADIVRHECTEAKELSVEDCEAHVTRACEIFFNEITVIPSFKEE